MKARAAVLIDAASGRVLYARAAHARMSPASTTKIMTALLVTARGELARKVRVSARAAATGESSIWLAPGEVLSRRDLLYALMLNSANDAAVALAEDIAGSEQRFVALMNAKARALNLRDTHFANPHGLEAPGHYSSAYDLALLAREALRDPVFRRVVATKTTTIPWPGHSWDRLLVNKNRLLFRYPGAFGVKPGYTRKAGNCLVGAARRNGLTLIVAVLNSPCVYDDAAALLDYGFARYRAVTFRPPAPVRVRLARGKERAVSLVPQGECRVALLPGEETRLEVVPVTFSRVRAPVRRGEVLGFLSLRVGKRHVGWVNLVAAESVPRGGLFGFFSS